MATYNKFQPFVEHLAEKNHDLDSDQLVAFLTTHANIPDVTDAVIGDITVISYTNLSSRNITTISGTQTSGTYKLVLSDLPLTASGAVATFRHAGIYNDTSVAPADGVMAWWDYGSDITLASGESFTYDFDATNGVLQIV